MDKGSIDYRRFLEGDEDGLAQIITDYKDGLILYLNTLVSNIALAEDLAEDTFVRLFTRQPKDKGTGSFKTWLYTIGRNLAISYLRKTRTQATVPIDTVEFLQSGDEPLTAYLKEESRLALHQAMENLKPEHKQILWLIYFEELSYKDAAKVMKKSVHSTEMLASRARQALKTQLNGLEVTL